MKIGASEDVHCRQEENKNIARAMRVIRFVLEVILTHVKMCKGSNDVFGVTLCMWAPKLSRSPCQIPTH